MYIFIGKTGGKYMYLCITSQCKSLYAHCVNMRRLVGSKGVMIEINR